MTLDKLEKVNNSMIHHGKFSDRAYLMSLDPADRDIIVEEIEKLADKHDYSKIVCKSDPKYGKVFTEKGYEKEASVPPCGLKGKAFAFYSKILDKKRAKNKDAELIEDVIRTAKSYAGKEPGGEAPFGFSFRKMTKDDAEEMAKVYSVVFDSYPFPIQEAEYIRETMDSHVDYYGAITDDGKLAALSSAEKDEESKSAEMTDFATLPDFRGQNLSHHLLRMMQDDMKEKGYNTLFTIARSVSYGMNITFARSGYLFSGTLLNNTNIGGGIESMNIWYKHLL